MPHEVPTPALRHDIRDRGIPTHVRGHHGLVGQPRHALMRRTASIVRKAVFPMSCVDIGMLPATKAAPREMLTVVDKPLIQYAVEEAAAAGIREMVFVTSRSKRVIEDHFDMAYELEAKLLEERGEEMLARLRKQFPSELSYLHVRQPEDTGLTDAVLCARPLVGDEPFAVIIPHRLIGAERPTISMLLAHSLQTGRPVKAVVRSTNSDGGVIDAGRYVLTARILDRLAQQTAGGCDFESAIDSIAAEGSIDRFEVEGPCFDCGNPLGLLSANVHFGLRHPEIGRDVRELICTQARTSQEQALA